MKDEHGEVRLHRSFSGQKGYVGHLWIKSDLFGYIIEVFPVFHDTWQLMFADKQTGQLKFGSKSPEIAEKCTRLVAAFEQPVNPASRLTKSNYSVFGNIPEEFGVVEEECVNSINWVNGDWKIFYNPNIEEITYQNKETRSCVAFRIPSDSPCAFRININAHPLTQISIEIIGKKAFFPTISYTREQVDQMVSQGKRLLKKAQQVYDEFQDRRRIKENEERQKATSDSKLQKALEDFLKV